MHIVPKSALSIHTFSVIAGFSIIAGVLMTLNRDPVRQSSAVRFRWGYTCIIDINAWWIDCKSKHWIVNTLVYAHATQSSHTPFDELRNLRQASSTGCSHSLVSIVRAAESPCPWQTIEVRKSIKYAAIEICVSPYRLSWDFANFVRTVSMGSSHIRLWAWPLQFEQIQKVCQLHTIEKIDAPRWVELNAYIIENWMWHITSLIQYRRYLIFSLGQRCATCSPWTNCSPTNGFLIQLID